jgi:hypothetical protein
MSTLNQFVIRLKVPIEAVTHKELVGFIDHLLAKRLKPKTINCYLDSIPGTAFLFESEAPFTGQKAFSGQQGAL